MAKQEQGTKVEEEIHHGAWKVKKLTLDEAIEG